MVLVAVGWVQSVKVLVGVGWVQSVTDIDTGTLECSACVLCE